MFTGAARQQQPGYLHLWQPGGGGGGGGGQICLTYPLPLPTHPLRSKVKLLPAHLRSPFSLFVKQLLDSRAGHTALSRTSKSL